MPPPATVVELVERFDSNLDAYRSGGYNEAQLRQEFLNPFCHLGQTLFFVSWRRVAGAGAERSPGAVPRRWALGHLHSPAG